METITEKACSRCGEIKVASEFRSEPRNRSGLSSACAECQRKQQKNRYWRDKDRIRQAARDAANQRVPDTPEAKLCPKCGIVKPSDLFYKDKYQADGLQNACKDCRRPYHQTAKRKEYNRVYAATRGKEIGKLYREENADYIKASKKQYRLDNLDAVKARDLRYREEHKDVINEKERNKRRENRRQAVAILGNHCVLCKSCATQKTPMRGSTSS